MVKFKILLSFLLLSVSLNGQVKLPGSNEGSLKQLIEHHKLVNLKSGMICTGERNDTLFAVFYLLSLNDLICIPIASLDNDSSLTYENEKQLVFHELRKTNGILSSKKTTNFCLKKEKKSPHSCYRQCESGA